jgi:hypothetical protein
MSEAVQKGASLIRVLGDACAFSDAASPDELIGYEQEFEERIAHHFPVVAMCQYDVRLFSGPMIIDALKAHPDCFRHPPERILA